MTRFKYPGATFKGEAREKIQLKVKPVKAELSEKEKEASKIIPKPTGKVKEGGYRGYWELINQIPKEAREKYPFDRSKIADTNELGLHIDGKNSVLEIKHMLDAQYSRESDIQTIINYLQILKLIGLIEM